MNSLQWYLFGLVWGLAIAGLFLFLVDWISRGR